MAIDVELWRRYLDPANRGPYKCMVVLHRHVRQRAVSGSCRLFDGGNIHEPGTTAVKLLRI
jgi:hypothetical protein